MAFRLIDILHHTQLRDVGQIIACLEMINQAPDAGAPRSIGAVLRL